VTPDRGARAATRQALRQSEAFGLRVADIGFRGQRVEIRQQMRHVTRQGLVVAPPDARQGAHGTAAETVAAAVAERVRGFPAERDGLVLTNRRAWPINPGSFNALGGGRRSARRG
jgi:hypothetical protein